MKHTFISASAICGLLLAAGAQAAVVDFFIDGSLGLTYGSDDYDLDGADITWTFSYDSNASNVGSGSSGSAANATYDALAVDITFTNRPNGAADISLSLDTSGFFNTTNVFSGSDVDKLGTVSGSGVLPDDGFGSEGLAGLMYSDFVFEFANQNFFSGSSPAALPVITNADIAGIFTPAIEDGFASGYDFVSLGISVTNNASVVPVPAAVWLFGSGLLGLLGVAHRSRA